MSHVKHRRKHHVTGGGSSFPTTGLEGFWPLNESSGNAIDAHTSGNDLDDNNTVGSTSSQTIGSSSFTVRSFVESNSEFFDASDTSKCNVGINDFCICGWIKVDSNTAGNTTEGIISKRLTGSTSNPGWSVAFTRKNSDNSVRLRDSVFGFCDGTNEVNFPQTQVGFDHDVWFHFILTVDRTADEAKLYINNSLLETLDISSITGSLDNSEPCEMGLWINQYAYIHLSHVGMWVAHLLTESERNYLYNSGTPIAP